MGYGRGIIHYAAGVLTGVGLTIVALGGLTPMERVEVTGLLVNETDNGVNETERVTGWRRDTWWQPALSFGLWEGFRPDGSLVWQTCYEAGEQHGPSVRYDQHGNPVSLVIYSHGQQVGGMDLETPQDWLDSARWEMHRGVR